MNRTTLFIGIAVLVLIAAGVLFALSGDSPDQVREASQSDAGAEATADTNDAAGADASPGRTADEQFDRAPAFSLKDYEGNTVSLSDFDGKVRVVNSWAVWCPFCVDELPAFAQLQEAFPEEVVVISIDRQESLEKAKGFTDGLGITDDLIFLLDPNDSFYKSIGGFSMPETLFIDGDGFIRIHKRGPMEFEEMKDKVESILNS